MRTLLFLALASISTLTIAGESGFTFQVLPMKKPVVNIGCGGDADRFEFEKNIYHGSITITRKDLPLLKDAQGCGIMVYDESTETSDGDFAVLSKNKTFYRGASFFYGKDAGKLFDDGLTVTVDENFRKVTSVKDFQIYENSFSREEDGPEVDILLIGEHTVGADVLINGQPLSIYKVLNKVSKKYLPFTFSGEATLSLSHTGKNVTWVNFDTSEKRESPTLTIKPNGWKDIGVFVSE
ncbi:MAG: hypothetical protein GY774_23100 [Planctomycetes bacterium]|nr:hypothetical protein [Planctomycetota bacterium]|tara:strand:- start:9645 stop:10358 length:714 start_codon:yes stop_codon:yes gene_type:complete